MGILIGNLSRLNNFQSQLFSSDWNRHEGKSGFQSREKSVPGSCLGSPRLYAQKLTPGPQVTSGPPGRLEGFPGV